MNQFLKILFLGLVIVACDNPAPSYNTEKDSEIAYKGSSDAAVCLPGRNFVAKKESFVSWRATKFTVSSGKETLMVGTNAVLGSLNLSGDWSTAVANMDFVASTTNSEDPLRDSRINSFIFGLPDSVPFGFKLSRIEGDILDVKDNVSRTLKAFGTLYVGNQQADIEMPVLVKSYLGLMTLTPAEVFKLNVRSLSPVVNGVNLVDRIQQLLTFVPGVDLQNEVIIDFSLDFTPAPNCP